MRVLPRRAAAAPAASSARELFHFEPGELDGYVMTPRGVVGVVIIDTAPVPPRPLWRTAAAVTLGTVTGLVLGTLLFAVIAAAVLSGEWNR